ncbi:MAG: hypothetical protein IJT88_06510 [Kiritimatiellae bacterium]|nr:hypothetical protein [Kiritimatiellia bacterium]
MGRMGRMGKGGTEAARQNRDGGRMGRGVALVAGVVVALACAVAEGADGMTASLGKAEEVVFPRVELEEDGSGWVFRREEETGGAGGKGEKDAQDGQDGQEAKDGEGGREAKVWRASR